MMFEINNKNILVTGGFGEIGYECVKILLQKGAKNVVVFDIQNKGKKMESEINKENKDKKVHFYDINVTDGQAFKDTFKKVIDCFNSIEVLINCVGVINDRDWEQEIAINFTSVINSTLCVLNHMDASKKGKGGVILNVASIVGIYPILATPIYSGTKAGIIATSVALGHKVHYSRTNVRIICICPGGTSTALATFENIRFLSLEYGLSAIQFADRNKTQKAKSVAKSMVLLLETAESGTVWISEEDSGPQLKEYITWENRNMH